MFGLGLKMALRHPFGGVRRNSGHRAGVFVAGPAVATPWCLLPRAVESTAWDSKNEDICGADKMRTSGKKYITPLA